jgi:hypothetical protein
MSNKYKKTHVHILTCYMLTKLFLFFLHMAQKLLVLCEILCARIEHAPLHMNFFPKYFKF